ncbi:MAG TPA: GAF domain-containing protein [Gemmatimonadales bacterium]|nr:GAF domain-containing protein [Gemmatimonadales bacterium]
MPPAPRPANEAKRLAALRAYDVLDRQADESYQDIVRIAGHITGMPTVLISLIDAERQWFLARQGFAEPETHRDIAFCAYTILEEGRTPMVVPDASADPRFRDNPLVTGDTHIRFYAGAPLETPDGSRIGTLCALDQEPRVLRPEQLETLQALARQVVRVLELRRVAGQLRDALEHTRALTGLIPLCASCHRIREDGTGWQRLERFLMEHTDASVTHSICPECSARLYPGL